MKALSEPLNNEEFDQLQHLIQKHADQDSIQDLVDFDGFMAGISIGPKMILPEEWLLEAFPSKKLPWPEETDFNLFYNLASRHLNALVYVFLYEPALYRPMVPYLENGSEKLPEYHQFARAFERGLSLSGSALDNLPSTVEEKLAHLHLFADPTLLDKVYHLPIENARQLILNFLPNLLEVQKYWLQERLENAKTQAASSEQAPIADFRIPGETPCPCGSNNEFMKCCGAPKQPNQKS